MVNLDGHIYSTRNTIESRLNIRAESGYNSGHDCVRKNLKMGTIRQWSKKKHFQKLLKLKLPLLQFSPSSDLRELLLLNKNMLKTCVKLCQKQAGGIHIPSGLTASL